MGPEHPQYGSPAIKVLLRKRRYRSAGRLEALGGRFALGAGAAPEWSSAIKALLRKRRFWSPGPLEALGGRLPYGAGAAPPWSPAIKALLRNQ